MIRAESLSKTYGRTIAVRDVSFQVNRGEILGLLGPNGAGKTTIMRILTGYTPPTAGNATVDGLDVVKDSLRVRSRIGYLPEMIGLYEDMTVRSYLKFMAQIKKTERRRLRRHISDIIGKTGLESVANRLIGNLSRGYRQRVGLAQAMTGDPDILILDEPTVGLDPAQIREIRQLICSMKGEKTVILSTHILPEVTAVCSRIAIINLGKIAAAGTTEEIAARLEASKNLKLIIRGQPENLTEKLKSLSGVERVDCESQPEQNQTIYRIISSRDCDVREKIPRLILDAGETMLEFRTEEASLEDIYLKLVMGEGGGMKEPVGDKNQTMRLVYEED